ncbi:16S rRNA (cytosine967-C5)-methyltransferase [Hephaestia caeni]|uniref:16S rRNA (Cytosine967-C5)-methyltransferase n=1 Tax=Hephaestia caeni TaxID=645617 RepID=A0A397P8H5_9SPHN|nr:RsmB/NOP family class I SAM-dependent RNA methyltransferase [Hephaestia caeni]RIA45866.1 16S rRNA (cytosine967-C5)-methyltransferase [Hephaestia caeni]
MTPGGRAQAAVELLDAIIAAARDQGAAADTLIARYFAERRYAGSKDRRAVRELVYAAIRLLGERPENGRQAIVALARHDPMVAAMIDGSAHAPPPIDPVEPGAVEGIAPAWLVDRLERSGLAAEALPPLLERAPLDIRVNRSSADPAAIAAEIEGAVPLPHAPNGLRLPNGTSVEQLDAWRRGAIEVQDEGSQLVTTAAEIARGMRVVDLCAGAGGKTLALAAAMGNQGQILACDSDRARLSRLAPRAERAGATIVETRLLDPGREAEALQDWTEAADVVLVDAPCSGTGTWRRNPEARWRLTPDRLERLSTLQAHLLEVAWPLVKPGGALVYVVCSLLDEEGAGQIAAFLGVHEGWSAEPPRIPTGVARGLGWRLTPAHDGTDGFFVARLVRTC